MPKRIRVNFENKEGQILAGALEVPDKSPRAYALFAHCFSCSKDMPAASRIAKALAYENIAVFRFDFTGLGFSEGDFANTNFSSNIQDLVSAADFLRDNYEAPKILLGHSLGGAAVLACAHEIKESRAIVTIGAPSTANHVRHNFEVHEKEIIEKGQARVKLGGKEFTIKKQFLDDIENNESHNLIPKLKKALLIFHSPFDEIVSIQEAKEIYNLARHPKSFISLDKADHLLTNQEDAKFVAKVVAAFASRYFI